MRVKRRKNIKRLRKRRKTEDKRNEGIKKTRTERERRKGGGGGGRGDGEQILGIQLLLFEMRG